MDLETSQYGAKILTCLNLCTNGQKDKFQAPRSYDDVARDPDMAAKFEEISENICNEDVYEVAFPAEAEETRLEDLGMI